MSVALVWFGRNYCVLAQYLSRINGKTFFLVKFLIKNYYKNLKKSTNTGAKFLIEISVVRKQIF